MNTSSLRQNSLTLMLREWYGRTLRPQLSHVLVQLHEFAVQSLQGIGAMQCPELDIEIDVVHAGVGDGRWAFSKAILPDRSVVFSVGVGYDISFDRQMIEEHGATVHAFDPTSRSRQWLEKQECPSGLKFYPLGLAEKDETLEFCLPPAHSVSFTSLGGISSAVREQCEVRCLRSLFELTDVEVVDVLKIDIEGAEYSVIDDLIAARAQIGQLLIEFHTRMLPEAQRSATSDAIAKLRAAGFRLFDVSARGTEFSFLGGVTDMSQRAESHAHSEDSA